MSDVLLVRQYPLLPLARMEWESVIPDVVSDLRSEGEPIWMAPASQGTVDAYFVLYEARDHPQIEADHSLQAHLAAQTVEHAKLVLCVCDVSRPKVTEAATRELLVTQTASLTQDRSALRSQSFDEMADMVRAILLRRLDQFKVTGGADNPNTSERRASIQPASDASLYDWGAV